ncbi:MAG TPA: S8 family serine peptidase [Solirubrobacteraceae bacterium]|nr:S8 family serine peptidase [Solirubrobacteraceae bacterium]
MITLSPIRRLAALAAVLGAAMITAPCALAADYVPGEVVVGYGGATTPAKVMAGDARAGVRRTSGLAPLAAKVVRTRRGETVAQAAARLRHQAGVAYAVPNYIAHAASAWIPDDVGRAHVSAGWEQMQWNFLPTAGVDAPDAWGNLIADGRPGGQGVVVAVLDTGIAYRTWRKYRESPDFTGTRFIDPYDFVARTRYPLDRNGHGTLVAGTLAEATNNGLGLTGLAYGATIMPVRVLDSTGAGDATTIAAGIVYAVKHKAQVINLSLQFSIGTGSGEIPDIIDAIHYAWVHGVVVVAASGNDGVSELAYPARDSKVISVGATTADRCLAVYSNSGVGIDLVAPGGGDDAEYAGDPACNPSANLPDIYQMTLVNPRRPWRFGFPGGYEGTSMAAPHVSATAALIIASGVIGPHPTPDQIEARLKATAEPLGPATPNRQYGYGLVNAAAATALPAPPPVTTTPTPQPEPPPPPTT